MVGIATSGDSTQALDAITDADGTRLGARVGSDVRWFLPDLHGSNAALLAKDEASITEATRYDGYGRIVDQTASPSAGARAWKYQGRLDLSPAQGTADVLYEAGARLYSPSLGAFTSLDTVAGSAQDPLSMNRYLYAEANPATLIDPTGHAGCDGSGRRSAAAGGKPCPTTAQHNATPSPTTGSSGTSPAGTPGGDVVIYEVAPPPKPEPGPAPCLPGSCPTPYYTLEVEPVDVGGLFAGLVSVCAMSNVPIGSQLCDTLEGIGSLASGDLLGAGLSVAAYLPVGDALKGGRNVVRRLPVRVLSGALSDMDIAAAVARLGRFEKSAWKLDPMARGRRIDEILGNTLGSTYPVFDIYDEASGLATSIKSLDLGAARYSKMGASGARVVNPVRVTSQINDWSLEAGLGQMVSHGTSRYRGWPINARRLVVALPPGPVNAGLRAGLAEAAIQAQRLGVEVVYVQVH